VTDRPKRIQLSRAKGWRMPPGAVKVDRSTPWGNPFIVGLDGTAEQCVYLHRMLLAGSVAVGTRIPLADLLRHRQYVVDHLADLPGKDLACWCRKGQPCHADTLLELANAGITKDPA
jgi:hypothetical protein